MWYTFFGVFVTIIVSIICRLIFGGNQASSIDPMLLSPIIKNRFSKKINVGEEEFKIAPLADQKECSL